MKLSKLCKVGMSFLTKPYYRTRVLIKLGYYDSLSDEEFLKKVFPKYMGYPLDLENPKTFSEKLQWLKVNYREPIQTVMVDKHEAKHFISQRVGDQYIIPTLAVWDSVEDIDFDALPNQFVLKCTHDSGGIVICKDKSSLDREAAKAISSNNQTYAWMYSIGMFCSGFGLSLTIGGILVKFLKKD